MKRDVTALVLTYLDIGDKQDRIVVRRGLCANHIEVGRWRVIEKMWMREMKVDRKEGQDLVLHNYWLRLCKVVTVNGRAHSIDGEPAVVSQKGSKAWCRHGKLYRDRKGDLPTVVVSDGDKMWW